MRGLLALDVRRGRSLTGLETWSGAESVRPQALRHAVGYNAGAVQTRRIPEAPASLEAGAFSCARGFGVGRMVVIRAPSVLFGEGQSSVRCVGSSLWRCARACGLRRLAGSIGVPPRSSEVPLAASVSTIREHALETLVFGAGSSKRKEARRSRVSAALFSLATLPVSDTGVAIATKARWWLLSSAFLRVPIRL